MEVAIDTYAYKTIFVTGYTKSSTFNNNGNDFDIFVHSVDTTAGSSNWAKFWGGTSNDYSSSIAVSPDGSRLLVSGYQSSFLPDVTWTASYILLLFDF